MGKNSRVKRSTGIYLEDYVYSSAKGFSNLTKVLMEIYKSVEKGEIELIDPRPPKNFTEYLVRLDYSLWLHTSLLIVLTTIITILFNNQLMVPLRWFFGSILVLYLPGYAIIEALYPENRSLGNLERVALSLGLSLAVVPLIGLLLNYTPFGIRLIPIVISLGFFTSVMLIVAGYRKYRIVKLLTFFKW